MFRNLLFFVIIVSISSCRKDKVDLDVSGTWEMVSVSGMLGITTYQPGNGRQLVLESNGNLEKSEPGKAPENGHYSLSKKPDCATIPGREGKILITFHLPTSTYQCYVEITGDKLYINSEVCVSDGSLAIYRRI